jgi:hypothetical protein
MYLAHQYSISWIQNQLLGLRQWQTAAIAWCSEFYLHLYLHTFVDAGKHCMAIS